MDTLREYLVGLGFTVHDDSYRRFLGAIAHAGKGVAELGAETVATALAIGASVEKVARTYEDLYYVSQRTGSSVKDLRVYEFAARQIGLSADQARSSVEGFAQSIRTNPGLAAMLRGMGINPNDAEKAQGQFVKRLRARWGEGGYFAAFQFAQNYGFDERTFRQMWTNSDRLDEFKAKYDALMKSAGLDTKETSEEFYKFTSAVNDLETTFEVLGTRIAKDFVGPATEAAKWIDELTKKFVAFDAQTGGEAGTIGTIATSALGIWAGKRGLSWLFGGGSAAAGVAAGAGSPAWLSMLGIGLTGYGAYQGYQQIEELKKQGAQWSPWILALGSWWQNQANQKSIGGRSIATQPNISSDQGAGLAPWIASAGSWWRDQTASRDKSGGNLVRLTTKGGKSAWVDADAASDFQAFLNGMEAAGAPLIDLGGYNPRKIAGTDKWSEHAFGRAIDIDQLSRNRVMPEFARWAGEHPDVLADLERRYHIQSGGDWHNPDFGHFQWQPPWGETPLLGPQQPAASGPVMLHQRTEINVNGGADSASSVASSIAAKQDSVNARLVRNAGDQLQ